MKRFMIKILEVVFVLGVIVLTVYLFGRYRADYATGGNGRPLPTLSHFTDSYSAQELAMAERGHHIVPALPLFSKTANPVVALRAFDIQTLLDAKAQNLPLSFPSTQWENILKTSPYKDIDSNNGAFTGTSAMASNNPLQIDPATNTITNKIDCLGPSGQIDKWKEVGSGWASSQALKFIEELYPNPPNVNFLSNNEEPNKARWPQMLNNKRYQELYVATGRETGLDSVTLNDFRRRVVGDGWIERYSALIGSFRESLSNQSWKNNSIFTAYSSFGPSYFGRYWGWSSNGNNMAPTGYSAPDLTKYTEFVPRIAPQPYAFDGSSEEVYLAPYYTLTDFNTMSPQIESQNWIFMLEETRRRKPNYWFELIAWDGHKPLCNADIPSGSGYCCNTLTSTCDKRTWYESKGQNFTPARYAAMVQFSMWLTRPNSVREFRFPLQSWESELPYFLGLTKMVDRVYDQPVLTDFWQNGTLVENTTKNHPYNLIDSTDTYTNTKIRNMYGLGRWFMLNTNLDPSLPWLDYSTEPDTNKEIPVYSIALNKGTTPSREWLVYAHSPQQDRTGVVITVPNYQNITVDVSVAGNFYLVKESDQSITPITDAPAALKYLIVSPEKAVVNAGATQQFTAKGLDQYDQEIDPGLVTWSATGGTINQSGLFTAGTAQGDYEITAQSGTISGKIPVKVGSLVAQWNFDEQDGSLVKDTSNREHHCMFINPTWGVDGSHKYANFVKDAGSRITCDTDNKIIKPEELSISAWVKLNELLTSGGSRYIVATGEGSQANVYSLKYTLESSKHMFMFSVGDSVESHPVRSGTFNPEVGKWYMVTGVFNPGSYMRMYINGVLQQEITTNLPTDVGNYWPDLFIGKDFVGQIDDVTIYNQALTEQEIKGLFTQSNLSITKSADKTNAQTGEIINYTITYQNTGATVIQNAAITDTLDAKLELIGTPAGATVNGQILTWNISSIPANNPPQTLTFQCRVK